MNTFSEYMKKYGIRIGILVLVVAVVAGIAISRSQGRAGVLKEAATALSVPAKSAATGIIGWLEGIYGYMFRYDEMVAKNAELQDQVTKLENSLREAKEAETENEHFRELLELQDKHSEFKLESARVTGRESSNWSSTITVSKGEESGIEVGDCVVDSSYGLVGQVIETGTGWSTIRTVIDTDIRVGVLVGDGGSAAIALGDFAMMQKGQVKLSYLSQEAQVFEEDVLLTSGKGGSYPKGLVVGKVASIKTEAGGQVEYAMVTPACDLGSLTQVFVIKEFVVVE